MAWTNSNIYLNENSTNEINVPWMNFPGGEINITIPTHENELSKINNITAILKSSDDIMALLLTVDALKQANYELGNLTIPYFPYARQDRVCSVGESLSVKVIANLVNSLNFKTVTVFDPHSDVTTALINNVQIKDQLNFVSRIPDLSDYVIVCPDAGAEKKIYSLVKQLNVKGMIRLTKKRNLTTGEIESMQLVDYGSIKTSKFIIIDDICDGGRTFIEASKILNKEVGGNKKIDLYVTHGIFSKGLDVFRGYINNIFYSNSLKQANKQSIYHLNHERILL